ncbi:hypothetical protein Tco_0222492 [Tanacetum coccineum]
MQRPWKVSKGKELLGPNGRSGGKFEGGFRGNVESYGESCNGRCGRGGSIVERGGGLLAKHSIESKDGLGVGFKLIADGEECLDSWVGAGGGEVKGGGVVFGVSRTLLGEIPGDIIGESGGEALELMEEPIDNRWVVREDDKEGTPVEG